MHTTYTSGAFGPRVLRLTLLALTAASAGLITLASRPSEATPPAPQLRITSVHTGEAISALHPLYVAADETLLIGGRVDGIQQPADYQVRVMAMMVPLIQGPNTVEFAVQMPMGPRPPGWQNGAQTWTAKWPYRAAYQDGKKVFKPVVAELVHTATGRVLDRTRITLYDVRQFDPTKVQVHKSADKLDNALWMQLPQAGLDRLEAVHLDTLPHPNLAALNQELAAAAAATQWETDDYDNAPLCEPLSLNHPVVATTAYLNAEATALAVYEAYLACDANTGWAAGVGATIGAGLAGPVGAAFGGIIGEVAAGAACQSLCVKHPPTPQKFDVCVRQVKAHLTTASLAGVTDVQLTQDPATERLWSSATVTGIETVVQAQLSEIFVQRRAQACLPPIRFDLSADDLAQVDGWRTCNGLELSAGGAKMAVPATGVMQWSTFEVKAVDCAIGGATAPECVELLQRSGATFDLTGTLSSNTEVGTCADAFVAAAIEDVVEDMGDKIETALGDAWHAGATQTGHAQALTNLMAPLELGPVVTTGVDITATLEDAVYGFMKPLSFAWSPQVSPLIVPGLAAIPTHFHVEPADLPVDMLGINGNGTAFDISYTVTTGHLNQILRAWTGTKQLNFHKQLKTISAGGGGTGGGMQPAPPGAVTPIKGGTPPGQINPQPIPVIGGQSGPVSSTIYAVFHPMFAPIAYNPADIGTPGPEGMPLYYDGAEFQLLLVQVKKDGSLPKILLRVAVDFYDPTFWLSLPANPVAAAPFLEASWQGDLWWYTIVESNLPNCPLESISATSTCEKQLAARINALVGSHLRERMRELLTQIPAPLRWDARGTSAISRKMVELEREQGGQNLTFYGQLQ